MKLSDLNEAIILQGAGSPEVFKRGVDYQRRGAVEDPTLRGDILTAEVQGSDYEPYQVTIRLGKTRIESAGCSCPYGEEWDGWCKHIVAALLVAAHLPERVEKATPLSDLLDPMDRAALKALLLRLVDRNPRLASTITEEASVGVETEQPDAGPRKERILFPVVDTEAIRQQIKSAIRYQERSGWEMDSGISDILDEPIAAAEARLNKGDARGALATLEAVMDAYIADWTDFDDSDGEGSDPFYTIGRIAAEALFCGDDFSPNERQGWVRKLTKWQNAVDDYGADKAFSAAITAGERGWDDPALQRVLRGETKSLDWDVSEWTHSGGQGGCEASISLPDVILNILERRGQNEEALRFSLATGQIARATTLLVRLDRTGETIRLAETRAKSPDDALEIAFALAEADEIDTALIIGEMGLDLPRTNGGQGQGALARWLRDKAEAAGRPDLARRAAFITVREMPNLGNWTCAEQMAPSAEWSPLRDEILAELRRINNTSPYGRSELTLIFLHEHQIDDALHSIKGYANAALLAQVADAALEERPDAVLTMSRREAETIMDEGKSAYYDTARDWLRRYKTALSNLHRADDWVPYRNTLLEKHRRRYKLIPLIKELG